MTIIKDDSHAADAAADFLFDFLSSDPDAWDAARPQATALWDRVVAA